MTDEQEPDRWREIREIQKKHVDFYKLLGAVILVGLGVVIGRSINPSQSESFDVNLTTEIISIAVTVLIVNWFAERRAEQRYKQQLIDDAASISNEVAKNAIHQIRRKGWLEGNTSILQGGDLFGANLRGAELTLANLAHTSLTIADLSSAKLTGADLSFADMSGIDLTEANLYGASLCHARASFAQMRGADLTKARIMSAHLAFSDLRASNLAEANLTDAVLRGARMDETTMFDELTVLPDGSHWTEKSDLKKFGVNYVESRSRNQLVDNATLSAG